MFKPPLTTSAGRILKGDKPANLPVVLSTKYEMVLNLRTAKALGLSLSPVMLNTADDVIERAAHRLGEFGEVLVVTDDYAERDTVLSLGSLASSCLSFIRTIESTLAESQRDLKHHNRKERQRFQRTR